MSICTEVLVKEHSAEWTEPYHWKNLEVHYGVNSWTHQWLWKTNAQGTPKQERTSWGHVVGYTKSSGQADRRKGIERHISCIHRRFEHNARVKIYAERTRRDSMQPSVWCDRSERHISPNQLLLLRMITPNIPLAHTTVSVPCAGLTMSGTKISRDGSVINSRACFGYTVEKK